MIATLSRQGGRRYPQMHSMAVVPVGPLFLGGASAAQRLVTSLSGLVGLRVYMDGIVGTKPYLQGHVGLAPYITGRTELR